MTTTLIIVRHGNTFESGETPRRVGARTDLPLTEKGLIQAERVANWLKAKNIIPDVVVSGPLKRHLQMAETITGAFQMDAATVLPALTEVDYGPDENKPEEEVIARVGSGAIELWNTQAIVPEGWQVDVDGFRNIWPELAKTYIGKTVVVITSNGTARFALDLFDQKPVENLKLGTGCLGILEKTDDTWHFKNWHIKP